MSVRYAVGEIPNYSREVLALWYSLSLLTVSHCCVCILKYSVLLLIISFVFYLPPPCACVSAVFMCVCALVCSNITFRFVIFDFQLQLHTICLFNWISDVFVVYFPSISLFCICFFSSRSPSSLMLTPYNKNEQRSKNESFIFFSQLHLIAPRTFCCVSVK